MEMRRESRESVVLGVLEPPADSIDALIAACHRALSAEIWMTCCWPALDSGCKIGDFNYLVVSVNPDQDTSLYVQLWSEPQDQVLVEVCSGERCPGALRYVGEPHRRLLEERGYVAGGRARNFTKEVVVDTAAAAEALALETLRIFFDVFGYRGQWPLEVERHRGERAKHEAIYTGMTPEDFAKLAAGAGFTTTVKKGADVPTVEVTGRRRSFSGAMEWAKPTGGLYSLITLRGELAVRGLVTDDAIAEVNAGMRFVKVSRAQGAALCVAMPLVLDGGVTAAWLMKSLGRWLDSWRDCERRLRVAGHRSERPWTAERATVVH
jgi:hypothetical protein